MLAATESSELAARESSALAAGERAKVGHQIIELNISDQLSVVSRHTRPSLAYGPRALTTASAQPQFARSVADSPVARLASLGEVDGRPALHCIAGGVRLGQLIGGGRGDGQCAALALL